MMTIKGLRPQYKFDSPDKDVVLMENKPVRISVGQESCEGDGKAILHVGRKPRIKITMPLKNVDLWQLSSKVFNPEAHQGDATLELTDRNITLNNGHICDFGGGKWSIVSEENEFSIISWESLREPFTVLGNVKSRIDSLVFHLLNCPELSLPNSKESTGNGGWSAISIITLSWKDWIVEFKSIPKLDETIKQLRDNGGFGLTHVGAMRKKDNSTFKIEDIGQLRDGFSCFMDFVVGRSCWPCFCVGYQDGAKTYEDWGTTFSRWYSPMTWGTGDWKQSKASETLEVLFPLFMEFFNQEQTKGALSECISWYLSTTEPGRPHIDQALILLQAGIERMSYEYAVNQKKLIHKTGFKDLRASDRFRMLFSSLGIPLDIPIELSDLTNLAKQLNWEDVPHSLTEIRNAVVHPEHKRKGQIKDIYYDAWRVAIEYLELSILAFCGYTGQYYSRIKEQNINVPWKKELSS